MSVLSQLQHQIGELNADAIHMNGHDESKELSLEPETSVMEPSQDEDSVDIDESSVKKKASSIDLKNEDLFPSLSSTSSAKSVPAWRLPPTASAKSQSSSKKKPLLAGRITERVEIPSNFQVCSLF
jgi:hypothetical protein